MVAKDKFDSGASLQTWLKKWKARSAEAEEEDIGIKAEQGEIGAAAIHGWLQTGIAGNRQLAEWENHVPDAFFKKRPIKIDKVAWTPCGQSFTDFIKNCTKCKGCPATFRGTLHANNPSDALLMVTNKANEKTIIGVSLKATFKNADLTIYNGGVCGFLYLIVDRTRRLCRGVALLIDKPRAEVSIRSNNLRHPHCVIADRFSASWTKKFFIF